MTVDLKFLIQYLSRFTCNRDSSAVETDLAHFHFHALAVGPDLT